MVARVREKYKKGQELNDPSTKDRANRSEPDPSDTSGPSEASKLVYENECRRFANVYSSDELEALLKLRTTKDSMPLGWGIIRKLMAVIDKALRRKLELRAADESWSVRQIDAVIHEEVHGTKRSKGARPMVEPKNLTDLFQRLKMQVEESQRRLSHWTDSDFLDQTNSTRKVDESLRARVLAICKELKDLVKTVKVLLKKLESFAADGPELGKEAPDGTVDAQTMKKPT
jgi:hypothetical protein